MRTLDLFEMAAPTLYHGTSFFNAVQIIAENMLRAKTEHDVPELGPVKGVSLSRNRRFAMHWSSVAFELDRGGLMQRYRLRPFNYWQTAERPRADAREEAEEFVVGDITNLHRYLRAIHMTSRSMRSLERLHGPNDGFYQPLRQHPLLQVHSP